MEEQVRFHRDQCGQFTLGRGWVNETGLTIGVLYLPGFAQYQEVVEGEEASTLNQDELSMSGM